MNNNILMNYDTLIKRVMVGKNLYYMVYDKYSLYIRPRIMDLPEDYTLGEKLLLDKACDIIDCYDDLKFNYMETSINEILINNINNINSKGIIGLIEKKLLFKKTMAIPNTPHHYSNKPTGFKYHYEIYLTKKGYDFLRMSLLMEIL